MKQIFMGWCLGVLALILIGCKDQPHDSKKPVPEGKAEEHDHDHDANNSGARYEEGKGIMLHEETKKSLGLELLELSESAFQSKVQLTAQIYRSSIESSKIYGQERQGNAYATALVSPEVANQLEPRQKLDFFLKSGKEQKYEGRIFKIDPAHLSAWGKSETILEIVDQGNELKVGDFMEIELPLGNGLQKRLNIPRTALLESATGSFAFVQNGDFLLRTAVKIGAQNKESVEITEGLYEGDIVVVKPVEALYLIELRSTKGGGHCH